MIYTKEVGWSDRLLFKKPLSLPLFEKRPIVLPSSFVLNIYIYFFLSKKYFIPSPFLYFELLEGG